MTGNGFFFLTDTKSYSIGFKSKKNLPVFFFDFHWSINIGWL